MTEAGSRSRLEMLVVRNDLLACPKELRMPVLRLYRGKPQLDEAQTRALSDLEIRTWWSELVDEVISDTGVVASQESLARLMDSAGTLGWTDPRGDMVSQAGPGPR